VPIIRIRDYNDGEKRCFLSIDLKDQRSDMAYNDRPTTLTIVFHENVRTEEKDELTGRYIWAWRTSKMVVDRDTFVRSVYGLR
jgi:hypothetical protein